MPDNSHILKEPENFHFKPVCGVANQDGTVTVSGVNMTPEQIGYGADYFELDQLFAELDKKLEEKEKGKVE